MVEDATNERPLPHAAIGGMAAGLRMTRDRYEKCVRSKIQICGGCSEGIIFDYKSKLFGSDVGVPLSYP